MGRSILFLGPPGAGKGTQAERLARALGVPHISTGVMLRQAVADGTELGREADAIMRSGALVPDDLVVAMVKERLDAEDAACGYLLDGFPRNKAQAVELDEATGGRAVEVVILLGVDEDELVARLLARAEELGRADDNEETIRARLAVYREETEPLVGYYPEAGVGVVAIDGAGTVDDVFTRIVTALAEE